MKRTLMVSFAMLLLVGIAVAGVDFTGTWVLNASKSDQPPAGGPGGGGGGGGRGMGGMGGGEITVKQAGNVLTITRSMGGNSMDTSYTLDGAEHKNTTPMGEMKYKAVLSGSSVHVTGTQTSQRGERPIDQTYTLSADGKTLTVNSVMQGPDGSMNRKQVYDKK